MEAQGYIIESNVLDQENKSTIMLAKNGRISAGKNNKYDLKIKHMRMKSMSACVNTKPVHGELFRIFWHQMMACQLSTTMMSKEETPT